MKSSHLFSICASLLTLGSVASLAEDWHCWGGSPSRNLVNLAEKNMPESFDIETGENIKWVVPLGSQSYGNASIVDGKIFVGTNNEGLYDPEIEGDKGNILCFNEADGTFLWQAVFDKLSAGRVNDWPLQGICSSPWVEGDRLYFLNNRCEIVCCDTEGFLDGENDGFQDEKYKGDQKADIVWKYDMMEEDGVFPHNLATSSPLIIGDVLVVVTGNGVDEGHLNLPAKKAPSFIAVDKNTGEYLWDWADMDVILHGQWSSAAYGNIAGRDQMIFPGGDGWVYSLNPKDGKLLWKFNANPPDSVWELGGYATKNNIIATPVVVGDSVYLGVGQDPEHGSGIGHLYRIDATGTGDVTETAAKWHYGDKNFGRTMSTCAVKDGLVYVGDLEGYFYCIDAETGELVWKEDLAAALWGSALLVDDKVYIGDEDGELLIMKQGREQKVLGTYEFDSSIYTTPVAANGVLYVTTKSKLYAIQKGAKLEKKAEE